jgi:hypothetical protein
MVARSPTTAAVRRASPRCPPSGRGTPEARQCRPRRRDGPVSLHDARGRCGNYGTSPIHRNLTRAVPPFGALVLIC